ncbi:MAG TPA: phosphate signaling complex protein PhoU [Burkholderiaceae bacterium]|nr:phosphate signaling complex protein PhoU [Burkholderiaceae bacterium]
MPDHTYKQYDTEIDAMRSSITTMGGLVERQFVRAVDAVRYGDLRLVTQVLADERVVNQLHVESDLRCNQVIAKRQPIAVDLREIIGVIHSINDLERIGDEAKKIALKADQFADGRMPIPFEPVLRMAEIVAEMLRTAIDAFLRQDEGAAARIAARDAEVDALRDDLVRSLIERMSSEPGVVSPALAMVFVVQSIERVGDHAKNVAEYVVHVVSGVDPRHASHGGHPGAAA